MSQRNTPKHSETSDDLFRHLAPVEGDRNTETAPYGSEQNCFAPLASAPLRSRCATPDARRHGRAIATVATYDGLVDAIRRRIEQIGVPLETIDLHVGLADRHTSKLLSPSHIRAFGPKSFDLMMAGLGLRLVVHGDAETPALIRKRFGGYTNEGTSLRAVRAREPKKGRE